MRIKPLVICPVCEGHAIGRVGQAIIFKMCSECSSLRAFARTGSDRQESESERSLKKLLNIK